jgi:hypothetical protein
MLPRFRRAGLTELAHEATAILDHGGGPLCRWYAMSTEGSAPSRDSRSEAVKMTLAALADPEFWLMSGVYHGARGRKPAQ